MPIRSGVAIAFSGLLLAASLACQLLAMDESAAVTSEQEQFFENNIRPLLHEHCFRCHSGQAEKLKAGLRLDSREAMLQGGESGPAIVPGDPDESLLIQAVRYESFEMPPSGRLPDAAIELLERWIQDGAKWPNAVDGAKTTDTNDATADGAIDWQGRLQHWAWQVATVPDPPITDPPANSPVDAFLQAELARRGLTPSSRAPRHVLIRRAYYDLIGLPPLVEELQRWLDEPSENWFEMLVDELLESPHFGEAWARHWLDLVRYGESYGHEYDYPIPYVHRYRDYIIRAFNADVPYDQFVREHVAGDLLPYPRISMDRNSNESILATGFWYLGDAVHAPTDTRADQADRTANQIDVFAKCFLGMTIACARCHDHKFDPIPTQDYYALAGYLRSSRRQMAWLDSGLHNESCTQEMDSLRPSADRDADRALLECSEIQSDWLSELRNQRQASKAESTADPSTDNADKTTVAVLPSHPLFVVMHMLNVSDADPTAWSQALQQAQSAIEQHEQKTSKFHEHSVVYPVLTENQGVGWSTNGAAFVPQPAEGLGWNWFAGDPLLSEPRIWNSILRGRRQAGSLRSPTFTLRHPRLHHRVRARHGEIRLYVDGYFMRDFHPLLYTDGNVTNIDTHDQAVWITPHQDLETYVGHQAYLEYTDPGDGFLALMDIRFSESAEPVDPVHPWSVALIADPVPENSQAVLDRLSTLWRETHARIISGHPTASDIDAANALLSRHAVRLDAPAVRQWTDKLSRLDESLTSHLRALAMADGSGENEHVFIRGNPHNLGEEVPRRLPMVLGSYETTADDYGSARLDFTRRLTDGQHPLVARVIVNRIWHYLFGRGIVPSVDDFGAMGQPPSHPELLDWLANDFQRHGWSLKRTIRLIMCTDAYQRQSLPANAETASEDAEAVWLSHFPRRRLTAESIRDAMLMISGRWNREMYGPSVPIHLTEFLEGRGRPDSGPLDGDGRRSLYLASRRNFLSPMLLTFDQPIPATTIGRRNVSNVPAQSLMLMNDPFVLQLADLWSRSLMERYPSQREQRLDDAFCAALGRVPKPTERQAIDSYIDEQAVALSSDDDDPRIWRDVCHMIWNLKEFLYLD